MNICKLSTPIINSLTLLYVFTTPLRLIIVYHIYKYICEVLDYLQNAIISCSKGYRGESEEGDNDLNRYQNGIH